MSIFSPNKIRGLTSKSRNTVGLLYYAHFKTIIYTAKRYDKITLGSAISISPLYSMNSEGLDAKFSKPLSNDFNGLGEKWANRRK
jgi:hypothetical protein